MLFGSWDSDVGSKVDAPYWEPLQNLYSFCGKNTELTLGGKVPGAVRGWGGVQGRILCSNKKGFFCCCFGSAGDET